MIRRLPHAKAQRSEFEYDMRSLVEMVMNDMLAVLHLPDWPGATTLLLRFVTILGGNKGLQHSDAAVRQVWLNRCGSVPSSCWRHSALSRCAPSPRAAPR